MNHSLRPWEINSSLTGECLCTVARIIKDVRHRTLELYDPEEGDGVWSLGCRIYERTINSIEREAKKLVWLEIIRNGLYFVMLINGVPVRFYHGEVDNPNMRSLRRLYPELEVQQMEFPFAPSEWFWRLVVETENDGRVLRIIIAQFKECGNSQNSWEIPVTEPITLMTSVVETRREGVELERPTVGSRKEKVAEGGGNV
ncbi:MAG: hypothetical protein K8I29_20000 [Alphaproteobacteria bacterium]|uniref:Uncharacterized protein n=1 Tax=Candidatus Nitrobium versatile TaxID=2884831 RepID=A0A953SFH2_9BACT|nr:hypothetical protein [Candidatus Nitrobium versatile]